MADVKPSGPLWGRVNQVGYIRLGSLAYERSLNDDAPVRIIPGHGKVVPLALVEAIEAAYWKSPCSSMRIASAIRAAIEGAL